MDNSKGRGYTALMVPFDESLRLANEIIKRAINEDLPALRLSESRPEVEFLSREGMSTSAALPEKSQGGVIRRFLLLARMDASTNPRAKTGSFSVKMRGTVYLAKISRRDEGLYVAFELA